MNVLTNILALVFVLSFLVFFHEAGHFAVAKFFRFPVEVFSLGFGKRLFGFKWKETDYRVSILPLGGYVKVVGLGPDESDVVGASDAPPQTAPGTRWQRLLILFAGPAVNLVLALLLTATALWLGVDVFRYLDERPIVKHIDAGSPAEKAGVQIDDVVVKLSGRDVTTWEEVELALLSAPRENIPVEVQRGGQNVSIFIRPEVRDRDEIGYSGLNPFISATVGTLVAGYPAEKAGIRKGDLILSVNGRAVAGYYEVVRRIKEACLDFQPATAKPIELSIRRGAAETLTISVTPVFEGKRWLIGFRPDPEIIHKRLTWGKALPAAWSSCVLKARTTFTTVGRLFRGKGSIKQLSGPVAIAGIAGASARRGVSELIDFMAILSLQLGLLNLLPIPVLDGGNIFITLLESIARRDFSLRVKEKLLYAGFIFLVGLMAVVLVYDIMKSIR